MSSTRQVSRRKYSPEEEDRFLLEGLRADLTARELRRRAAVALGGSFLHS
jgi:hypothetical protein